MRKRAELTVTPECFDGMHEWCDGCNGCPCHFTEECYDYDPLNDAPGDPEGD